MSYSHIAECMLNVKLQLYVFSEKLYTGKFYFREKKSSERNYGSFIEKFYTS